MFDVLYTSEKVQNACEGDPQVLETINRIVNQQQSAGTNVERLNTPHLVLSARVNGKARILYTYSKDHRNAQGQPVPIILAYDPEHDYADKFMDPRTYARFFETHSEEFKKKIESQSTEKNQKIEHPKAGRVKIVEDKAIILDEIQLSVQVPAIIEGVAGSGKTTVAYQLLEEFLENIKPDQSVLYVAQSQELITKMRGYLTQSHMYDPVKHENQIKIITYAELIGTQYPGLTFSKNAQASITEWLVAYLKVGHNREKNKRAVEMYLEFRIICGLENPADYLTVSEKITNLPKEKRQDILNAYIEWSKQNKEYFVDFQPLSGEAKPFDLVLVDEAQDLSYRQLRNMILLAKNDSGLEKIVFCLDPKQNLRDNAGKVPFIETLFKNKKHVRNVWLEKSYRCPVKILRVAKAINDARLRLVKTGRQEAPLVAAEKIDEQDPKNGLAIWLDSKEPSSRMILDYVKDDPKTYILSDEEDSQKLRAEGFLWNLTVDEVKGLENDRIIIHEVFKPHKHTVLKNALISANEGAVIDREANLELGPVLCQIFTLITRAQSEVIFYQTPYEGLSELFDLIKPLCKDKSDLKQKLTASIKDNLEGARKLMANGNLDKAREILLKKVFNGDQNQAQETLKKWANEEEETKALEQHEKYLEQFYHRDKKEMLLKLMNDEKTLWYFESQKGPMALRYFLDILTEIGEEEDLSEKEANAIVWILKKLGANIAPCHEMDFNLLKKIHNCGLLGDIISHPFYNLENAYRYFKSKNEGAQMLAIFWVFFGSLDDEDIKGKVLEKYKLLVRIFDENPMIFNQVIHVNLKRASFIENVCDRVSEYALKRVKEQSSKDLRMMFNLAVVYYDYWKLDEGQCDDTEKKLSAQLILIRKALQQNKSYLPVERSSSSARETQKIDYLDVMEHLTCFDKEFVKGSLENRFFLEELEVEERLFQYFEIFLLTQPGFEVHALLIDAINKIPDNLVLQRINLLKKVHSCFVRQSIIAPSPSIELLITKILNSYGSQFNIAVDGDRSLIQSCADANRMKDIFTLQELDLSTYMRGLKINEQDVHILNAGLDYFLGIQGEIANRDTLYTVHDFFSFASESKEKWSTALLMFVFEYDEKKTYNSLAMSYVLEALTFEAQDASGKIPKIRKRYQKLAEESSCKVANEISAYKWHTFVEDFFASLSGKSLEERKSHLKGFADVTYEDSGNVLARIKHLIAIDHQFMDWNCQHGKTQKTALIILASSQNDLNKEEIRFLIDVKKVDLTVCDAKGMSAFAHAAARKNNTETLKIFYQSNRFNFIDSLIKIPAIFRGIAFDNLLSCFEFSRLIRPEELQFMLEIHELPEPPEGPVERRFVDPRVTITDISVTILNSIANNDIESIKTWSSSETAIKHLVVNMTILLLHNFRLIKKLLIEAKSPHVNNLKSIFAVHLLKNELRSEPHLLEIDKPYYKRFITENFTDSDLARVKQIVGVINASTSEKGPQTHFKMLFENYAATAMNSTINLDNSNSGLGQGSSNKISKQ